MITFFGAVLLLLAGYFLYGRLTERIFGPDGRQTPAVAINDGVDCVPLKPWRAFLIQFLNIAGTGPIFGALMGAEFGPVVYLWIVAGAIFGGAVHDYMTGMISCRHEGRSVADLSGIYLGKGPRTIMRIFSLALLLLVGAVFVTSPAALLSKLTPDVLNTEFWIYVILAYFILATLLPIDKLIGRLYPLFGAVLLLMALGIIGMLLISGDWRLPEITFENQHPEGLPAWPFMCVTVACGAISGFHATQSPMVAKCIMSEKQGRTVFYGAMICESVVALVWAAAGISFYQGTDGLAAALTKSGQSGVVYEIAFGLMGIIGGIMAVIGVVVCPITSGDTAFRSARLILAEWTGVDQKKMKGRLLLTVPLLFVGLLLTHIDFNVLWRYFSWSNQTLAAISLCVAAKYLILHGRKAAGSLAAAIPGAFMCAVSFTYILMADEGFRLPVHIAVPAGAVIAAGCFAGYLIRLKNHGKLKKS